MVALSLIMYPRAQIPCMKKKKNTKIPENNIFVLLRLHYPCEFYAHKKMAMIK